MTSKLAAPPSSLGAKAEMRGVIPSRKSFSAQEAHHQTLSALRGRRRGLRKGTHLSHNTPMQTPCNNSDFLMLTSSADLKLQRVLLASVSRAEDEREAAVKPRL